ncbi:hypothetical protein [Streptomyces sp. NPDC050388]|uniref:hypothetical protein n=1 Tax=Streptomyces sp. NPDC050388 TaxID=3155781 RepID=UPI0034379C42
MPDTQLTVTLSGEDVGDARVVVRALEQTFGAPDELPSDEKATVHMATFTGEARAGDSPTVPGHLSAPVAVTVQGAPGAVRRASDTLAQAFTTRDEGAASGDQEQERQLFLEP